MLKKAVFSIIFSLTFSTNMFSMDISTVQTATQSVKKSYQKCVIQLKKIEMLNKEIYSKTEPIISTIIRSDAFKEKMNSSVEAQYNAIVNNNESFTGIKQETTLTDFVPNSPTNSYIQTLYSIMAKKAYLQLLWQKLSAKEKELTSEFEKLEKELIETSSYE